jgi:hypothetical protein
MFYRRFLFLWGVFILYLVTNNPVIGLVTWYCDFPSFSKNKPKSHKILTSLYDFLALLDVYLGVTLFLEVDRLPALFLGLLVRFLVYFLETDDDDWDDKLDKLKDAAKSVFWMGRWRSNTTVVIA